MPGAAVSVGEGVVGQDALHGDVVGGVEGHGAAQKSGAGLSALVVKDLGVGQSRMVINGGVDVVKAEPSPAVMHAGGSAAVHAPTAAGRDAAELS